MLSKRLEVNGIVSWSNLKRNNCLFVSLKILKSFFYRQLDIRLIKKLKNKDHKQLN